MSMLEVALDPATVIVAVDPGKVMNRVWVSNGAGLLAEPVSLPVSRAGVGVLEHLLAERAAGELVIAVEATGDCTGRGSPSWKGITRVQCGCSRPRKPELRERNWDRDGLRQMIATARTWPVRDAAATTARNRRWTRCGPRCATVVVW